MAQPFARRLFDRTRVWLPAFWAGGLVTVAAIATPAPFALLAQADAGRVVGRILSQEAYASLAFGALALLLERGAARSQSAAGAGSQFSGGMVLALAAIFLTVLGYFAVQPMMAQARAGQGSLSFGQLHLISAICYGLKTLAVLALAWRNSALPGASGSEAPGGGSPVPGASASSEKPPATPEVTRASS